MVTVVAAIDGGLAANRLRRGPDWTLIWATACWLALAKPWFFLALTCNVYPASAAPRKQSHGCNPMTLF